MLHNTEDRHWKFNPPEDRIKCDRMWTTDIEIIGMVQEDLAEGEGILALHIAQIQRGVILSQNEVASIEALIKKVAKLRARLTYHQEKCRYYAAYMATGSRLGFREDQTDVYV